MLFGIWVRLAYCSSDGAAADDGRVKDDIVVAAFIGGSCCVVQCSLPDDAVVLSRSKMCFRSGLTGLFRRSVVTHQGNELTRNSSENARPQSSQLAEPLWTDP